MKKNGIVFLSLLLTACGTKENPTENVIKVEEKTQEIEHKNSKNLFEPLKITTLSGSNPSIDITMSQEIEEKEVESYIKLSPNIEYKVIKTREHLILTGDFDVNQEYQLKLLKGLKGRESILERDITEKVVFKELEPKITFSNTGIILPKSNENKIAFKSLNVKKVNVEVKKVFFNNITQFLQDFSFKGNGNIFDYYLQNNLYKVGETVFSKEYNIDFEKNVWHQNEIDIGKVTKDKGIYIVELSFDRDGVEYNFPINTEEWRINNFFETNGKIGKAIIISDMGMIAQQEKNGRTLITVVDLIKNRPLADVKIKGITVNNQVLKEVVTDKNGEAVIESGEKLFYLLGEKNGEFSILKLSDSKLSYDGFLVDGEFLQEGTRAFLYSDRGVYRPGDKINISIIARNDEKSFPQEHPIKLDIFTPRGDKYIANKILENGKNGFYTFSFETKELSDTGIWEIVADIGGKKFSLKIPVETVVPYKIEVDGKFPTEVNIAQGEKLSGEVSGKYLFGNVAKGLKFNSDLTVKEEEVVFEKFKNYNFSNPTTFITNFRDSKSGVLNDEGKEKIEFDISKLVPKNLNLSGVIVTRVIEESGRPVIDIDKVKLNNFDTYVGIEKPEDTYIKSGDKLNLQVISVSSDGERLVSRKKLKYRIYKNEYSWWWDYYSYNDFIKSIKTDKNTVLLYEKEFTSSDIPYVIDYEITGEGEIFVEVEDMETHQSAGLSLYTGVWHDSSNSKKIDKLKIETDKKEYKVGEKAHIVFEGTKGIRALITVEKSGKIIDRYWKDIDSKTNSIDIDVKEEFFPNAYVTVALFQKYENSKNDRPIRLYGAVPIIVKDESRKLNIKLDAPTKLMPKEKFSVKIENSEKTEMDYTISVVDEGLLQLTDYKTPNPYSYFYQKEGLQLSTYDNYSEIIGKTYGNIHQVLTTGGDGYILNSAMKRASADMNSFGFEQSKRFEPLAMFEGVLTTDDEGKGSVDFQLPNYTGAIRVMVTGANGEKYGSSEKRIEVKSPIVANISLPRVLKVNDEFKVPVKIFATEENIGDIEVKFEFLGVNESRKIQLKKGESQEFSFDVKVGTEVGNKKAILTVISKDYTNSEEIDIDVTSNSPYTYINKNYYVNGKKESIKFPEKNIDGTVKTQLTLSSRPIVKLENRVKELLRYPYGCVEQTVSIALPQLYIEKFFPKDSEIKEKSVKNINTAISKLRNFQMENGAFTYWAGASEGDLWATTYVGHFLTLAKEQGYYIPENLYNSWLEFEKNMSRDTEYDINLKAYTLYVLALAGEPQISEMNYLYDNNFTKLKESSKWYLATAYYLIGEEELARNIGNKLSKEVIKQSFDYYVDSYGSQLRDEAILLNSYYTIYNEVERKIYNDIVETLQSKNWLSTQSIGYSLMAIGQIVETSKELPVKAKITVDGKLQEVDEKSGVFTLNLDSKVKNIEIEGKDIFVNQYWEGIPIDYQRANESKNISIERKFYADNGEEIDVKSLEVGKTFYMELKVLPAKDINGYFYVDNVALTQIIPSGWEIENTRLLGLEFPQWAQDKMGENKAEYEDIRDDRINIFFDFNSYDKNGYSFFVKLNAVTKGKYELSGTTVEAMYNNEYRAYLNGFQVEVK